MYFLEIFTNSFPGLVFSLPLAKRDTASNSVSVPLNWTISTATQSKARDGIALLGILFALQIPRRQKYKYRQHPRINRDAKIYTQKNIVFNQ
jgi:hypothetical protein